jgi:hypothetical protein
MVMPTPKFDVIAAEYYQPEVLGTSPLTITSFYKLIVLLKSKGHAKRVFKLEMSKMIEEFYVLKESGGRQIIRYGARKPQLRQVAADVVKYLNGER